MSDRFLVRQLVQLGLAANAFRPLPGGPAMVPAFFSGWLTSELAPHLAGLAAARHRRRTSPGTASMTGATRSGPGSRRRASPPTPRWSPAAGRRRTEIEEALVETLGDGYRERIARDPLPDDESAPWRALAMPFRMRNLDVTAERRLPYAPGGRRFELDVYHHRDKPTGAPVLLQVHGGAWMIGNKEQQGIPLMMHMAARGWVCVAVNYPLSPKARWPDHLVALKRAMRWIREHGDELRRRSVLRRCHRRLGRWPPGRHAGADRRRPVAAARLRGRRHVGPGLRPALRRLRLHRGER